MTFQKIGGVLWEHEGKRLHIIVSTDPEPGYESGQMPDFDDGNAPWGIITESGTMLWMDGVKNVGNRAFAACAGISSVNIPETCGSIGTAAFADCFGLTSLVIPKGTEFIGPYAFIGCKNVTEITFSGRSETVDEDAFLLNSVSPERTCDVYSRNNWAKYVLPEYEYTKFNFISVPGEPNVVWYRTDGTWKKGIDIWIKKNGVWKKGEPRIRDGGRWNRIY